MRSLLVLALLGGCESGHTPATGFVAFVEADTFDLVTTDLFGGVVRLDDGTHGSLSFSPNARWIATVAPNRDVRVFGRDGTKRMDLLPGGGDCASTPLWYGDTLQWCISDGRGLGTVFLPDVKGTPRRINALSLVVSPDGRRLAYLQIDPLDAGPRGDLVVENVDGTSQRVLASGIEVNPRAFSADGEFVVVDELVDALRSRVTRFSVADGSATLLGDGATVSLPANGPSEVSRSPDGSEILVMNDRELRAWNITRLEQRLLATLAPGIRVQGAGFLDPDRIVYVEHRDESLGDIGMFHESVHVIDASSDVRVTPDGGLNAACFIAGVGTSTEVIAVDCDGARLVTFDGTVLARAEDAFQVVGLVGDESGMISVRFDGTIDFVPVVGPTRELGHAANPFTGAPGSALEPFVAYAP